MRPAGGFMSVIVNSGVHDHDAVVDAPEDRLALALLRHDLLDVQAVVRAELPGHRVEARAEPLELVGVARRHPHVVVALGEGLGRLHDLADGSHEPPASGAG